MNVPLITNYHLEIGGVAARVSWKRTEKRSFSAHRWAEPRKLPGGCADSKSLHDLDSYLCAVRADLGNVHRMAQDRQRVKGARTFSPHLITDLPDTFGQMIDEHGDLAIAQFLINPLLAPGEIEVRSEIHQRGILALKRARL